MEQPRSLLAQVLVTSDHLSATAADDGLEIPEKASHSAWNIGYFYLSHTALPAMLHWSQMCSDHPKLWDQNLFKDVLKIGGLHFSDAVLRPHPDVTWRTQRSEPWVAEA